MDKPVYKILLVDDDPDILEFLAYNLDKEGFEISKAMNGRDGIELARKIHPHLILLDVMMPEMDGIETCQQMRLIYGLERTMIAFLTARGEDYSQIAGFEAGADDYITKPIKPKVLISRINALLKRYNKLTSDGASVPSESRFKRGDILIDREKYLIEIEDQELVLPRKEFELLILLSSKPGKVFTRDEIFSNVWGDDVIVGDRTIDVHIRKLREKIGDKHIDTVKGIGYKFIE